MTTPSLPENGDMPEWVKAEVQSARNRVEPYAREAPMILNGQEHPFRRYDRSVVWLADRLDARDREIAELKAKPHEHEGARFGYLLKTIDDLRTQLAQAQREREEARTFQWNAFDEFLDSMRGANGPLAMASAAVTLRDALAALASHPTPKQGDKSV